MQLTNLARPAQPALLPPPLAMLWPATAFATLARLDLGGVLAILPRQEAGAVRMELLTRAQPIRMLLPAAQL